MKNLLFLLAFATFACSTDKSISDSTAPVITLTGDNRQIVNLNDNYVELGATATDEIDGNITNQINITSSVDTSKEGTYIITYSVSDKAGNTTTITREVIVKYLNPIYLDSNGITVKAHDWAEVGMVGTLNGKRYTIVDRAMLLTMLSNNNDLSAICTTKITNMSKIFSSSYNFNQNIGSWDVSNVTDMNNMFYQANSFNQDIGSWNLRNVTNMSSMFMKCPNFNQYLGKWDVSNVTNMGGMFLGASKFNQNISNWDVSNATDMNSMFTGASTFNQNIGKWNVSKVTIMQAMFMAASEFNQDLTGWCVTKITALPTSFASGSNLTLSNHPKWGTCPN